MAVDGKVAFGKAPSGNTQLGKGSGSTQLGKAPSGNTQLGKARSKRQPLPNQLTHHVPCYSCARRKKKGIDFIGSLNKVGRMRAQNW